MKLNQKGRELLGTIISLLTKLLDSESPSASRRGGAPRQRRSRTDAAELRNKVREAYHRKISVKQIADDLGVTPSYVYQLLR